MIRIELALRFALLGTLALPTVARGQDPAPAPRAAAGPDPASLVGDEEVFADLTNAVSGRDEKARPKASRPASGARWPFPTTPSKPWAASFDALEANYGITLAPLDEVLRVQLEIPAGQGVVVVAVRPGSLAEQAGLKPSDVLLNLGDQRVMGVNQARGILLALGKEAVEVKLIREGKPRRMSLVGPEHGFPPESSEYWIGVPVSPVDATLRSHLADLPSDAGLIVNDVVKESPADRSGVKKNDILVTMGGKPLKSPDSLIEQVQASGGKPVPLMILRAGKMTMVEVTPAKRAHPTIFNLPGRTDLQVRQYQVVRPNVAVEVVPQTVRIFRSDPFTIKYDPIVVNPHHVYGAPLGQEQVAHPVARQSDGRSVRGAVGSTQYDVPSGTADRTPKHDSIAVNPHRIYGAPLDPASRPLAERDPIDIQLEVFPNWTKANVEEATARIEAQLKELSAKMEEVRKAVEGMRKAEGK